MQALKRAAGWAALVIGLAFAVHNLNGAWIEPRRNRVMGDRAKFQQHYDRFKATGRLPWQHAEPNRFLGAVHQARE
jgi:hypothetical protein